MQNKDRISRQYADKMYLLSFIDTSDRLDILLLEIRHLQQSIIDSLHVPTLLLPLRYEEEIIFGEWQAALESETSLPDIATVASRGILRYPAPGECTRSYYKTDQLICGEDEANGYGTEEKESPEFESSALGQKRKGMRRQLHDRIGQVWIEDLWSRSERRNYHALRALQILKQQIFKDKVCLYRYGKSANLLDLQEDKIERHLSKPAFMIAKRGIMKRVGRYIAILRTHQQSFGKSLDFGLQRYPRPSIERRREIGIFNDFLSNRSRDIQHDMLHLVNHLTEDRKKKEQPKENNGREISMLFHGWSQFTSVKNTQLYDDVARYSEDFQHNDYQDVSYVDTSIWSPDRPDLQPLIAREVARSILKSRLEGLSDTYLSNRSNDLTQLMVQLSRIIVDECEDNKQLQVLHETSRKLVYTLAMDLLAASVKGASYLYALYLELIAEGLENQLRSQTGIRLEIAFDLNSGVGAYYKDFMWYFRLRLTAHWVKNLLQARKQEDVEKNVAPPGNLEMNNTLIEGVDNVCEDILTFLDENTPKMRKSVGHHWQSIVEKMMEVIGESSMLEEAKQWRLKRADDSLCEKVNEGEVEYEKGEKKYHRSTMLLDVRVQNYLVRLLVAQKKQEYKPLYYMDLSGFTYKGQLEKFAYYYGFPGPFQQNIPYIAASDNGLETLTKCYHPRNLFRQLHDIPHQCAILRSMDLLGTSRHSRSLRFSWVELTRQIHKDMNLGRDLFSIALEFYTWRRDSPKSRLLSCMNLIAFSLPAFQSGAKIPDPNNKLTKASQKIVEKLEMWMYADDVTDIQEKIKEQLNQVKNKITNCTHISLQQEAVGVKGGPINEEFIANYGAVAINGAFSILKASDSNSIRRLEQLAGYKLKHLLKLLRDYREYIQKNLFKGENCSIASSSQDKEYWNCFDELRELEKDVTEHTKSHDTHIVDNLSQLGSLHAFLKIRDEHVCTSSDHYFYKLLFNSIGSEWPENNSKWTLPQLITPVMLVRMAVSNFYKSADVLKNTEEGDSGFVNNDADNLPRNAYNLYEVLSKGSWVEKSLDGKSIRTRYLNTLGRYDVVGMTPVRLPCKCTVPQFEEGIKDRLDEHFVTHFSRREIAWMLNIYRFSGPQPVDTVSSKHCDVFDDENDYQVVSILSLSLQRRAMRLNITHRLLDAVTNNHLENHYADTTVERALQTMIKNNNKQLNIKALLTDGWGDLLLVFLYKNDNEDSNIKLEQKGQLLEDFFNLQNSLYEDFMIDRTEMIYTPQCLDAIVYRQASLYEKGIEEEKNYRFYFSIRFQDDRKLERVIRNFVATLQTKFKNKNTCKPDEADIPWIKEIVVFDMPGAYDVRVYFKVDYTAYMLNKPDSIYVAMIDWLRKVDKQDPAWKAYKNMLSVIDKLETGIERFSNCNEGVLPPNNGASL